LASSPVSSVFDAYHRWYYDTEVWETVEFLGVPSLKSVADMWNYQEILSMLNPALVVEFGTRFGGAALYFSVVGRALNPALRVISVDISHVDVHPRVRTEPSIHLMTCSSTDPGMAANLLAYRAAMPGPAFFILDSDHRKAHVLAEMELLRQVTKPGDYLVVEDGNINGNPVLPGWGEGPYEAVAAYREKYPDDYAHDAERESKFGFTFAPGGFLIRR
jgi:cephalosporin hydroxylase